jgi:tetratricopeptide (TPR) repeat protein
MRRRLGLVLVAVSLCGSTIAVAQRPKMVPGTGQGLVSPTEVLDREYGDLVRLLDRYRGEESGALDEIGAFWTRLYTTDRDTIPMLIKRLPLSLAPRAEMALTDLAFGAFSTNQVKQANWYLDTVEDFFDWTLGKSVEGTDADHARQFRFANDWYKAMIWLRFARMERAELAHALERAEWRFHGDPEVHLARASYEELEFTRLRGERRSDPRKPTGGRQSVELTAREVRAVHFYRDLIRRDPKSAEGRIRLAYLMMFRGDGQRAEALTLLMEAYDLAGKPPLSYLAALFAGDIEERGHRLDAASVWYRRAIAACPRAQTARLAYSHLLLDRQDDIRIAQNALRPLIGGPQPKADACEPDPWRMYEFGPAWRLNALLDSLHKQVHEPAEKSAS